MSSERETQAQAWIYQIITDAREAAFEAGLAYPFLNNKYSERRRQLAHEAQEAANEAFIRAQNAELQFILGEYDAVIEASFQVRDCLEKVRAAAHLAAIDEGELCRCPKCMTSMARFSARAHPVTPLADGTRCWMKCFQCFQCGTQWHEVYTDNAVLIERTITE